MASKPCIASVYADGTYGLRKSAEAYDGNFSDKNEALRSENTVPWDESLANAGT